MNSSTSTELRRSIASRNGAHVESQVLCAIMLASYATILAAMFVSGYTLLALFEGAARQQLVNVYLAGSI